MLEAHFTWTAAAEIEAPPADARAPRFPAHWHQNHRGDLDAAEGASDEARAETMKTLRDMLCSPSATQLVACRGEARVARRMLRKVGARAEGEVGRVRVVGEA